MWLLKLTCLLMFSRLKFEANGILTFNLEHFISDLSSVTNSTLQVDSQGRTFVIAGNQLLRLSRDLQLEHNVSLTDRAATISLSPDEQRLLVCVNGLTDRSCYLYSPSNLTVPPVATGVSIAGDGGASATSFATEGSFYVGSYATRITSSIFGRMKLSQYIYGNGTGTPIIRTRDKYDATESDFDRTMLYGFVRGEYAYFATVDGGQAPIGNYRILRVCHTTSCPGNTSPCPFTALYEQAIQCGSRFGSVSGEYMCGLSLVENFSSVPGLSVIVSRCRQDRSSDNTVCLYNLTAIDRNMDLRYDQCSMNIGKSRLAWAEQVTCKQSDFTDRCNFVPPLDNILNFQRDTKQIVFGRIIVNNIGMTGDFVTASVAIQVDGISIIAVAFSSSTKSSHYIAFYKSVNNVRLEVGDSFKKEPVSSAVRTLQWHQALDYIYAGSSSKVIRVPLEECLLHRKCSSCVSDGNPLCGWCVVENKCSRVSQCANGNSTSDRWIRTDNKTSRSGMCITNIITPNQYVVDDPQILSVSVTGLGLPAVLPGETYSCHLSDSQGRYNITVPAVTVDDGRNYTCNITNANFNYVGVQSVINFSFISSRGMVPFDTTANSLTIYRCSSASRCTDCLQTENACGWCSVNKICRGTPSDCITSTSFATFLRVMNDQTFENVCPLLLASSKGYSQHIRVGTDLQLTARNLHPSETGFSYICDIGGTLVPAMRNSDTAITCDVNMNQLSVRSKSNEIVDLAVIWTNGVSISHRIDTLSPVNVTLYDCLFSETGCSACVNTRVKTKFKCGWCDDATSSCRVAEECTMPIITDEGQCPAPTIANISPQSGPSQGGTIITITGRNLGVTFSDFTVNSITLRMGSSTSIACTPSSDDYVPGASVKCRTNPLPSGFYSLVVELPRDLGSVQATAPVNFVVLTPTVSGASPFFGPIAGGTELTITGTHLDIGNNAVVRVNGNSGICVERYKSDTVIVCSTPSALSASSDNDIVVMIDSHTITPDNTVQFSYRDNPTFTSVKPQNIILSGGTILTFIGINLDVAENPKLFIDSVASECMAVNSTILTCITKAIMTGTSMVSYVLRLDNAPPPNTSIAALTVTALPDPIVTGFTPDAVPFDTLSNLATLLTIQGRHFTSVEREEICIKIGGSKCSINRLVSTEIDCIVPAQPEMDVDQTASVQASFGRNINITLPNRLKLSSIIISTNSGLSIGTIIGIVAGILIIALLVMVLVMYILLKYSISHAHNRDINARMNEYIAELVHKRKSDNNLEQQLVIQDLMKLVPESLQVSITELRILDIELGQGQFGVVNKAHLVRNSFNGPVKNIVVAVKTIKGESSKRKVEQTFSEILKMESLSHPHIMNLLGVCISDTFKFMIIMPYMANGSLLSYLKKERSNLFLDYDVNEDKIVSVRKLLLKMCHQIAIGMAYLSEHKIVHRDLAARNCLLDSQGTVKISDFGLSEEVYTRGYFRQNKNDAVRLPFKWMAPESLTDAVFTCQSDVWSYGVTCWEVFSCGKTPYPGVNPFELPRLLGEGMRLDYPTNAANSSEIYIIFKKCWKQLPEDRPAFDELVLMMEVRLQAIAGYLELGMVLIPEEEIPETLDDVDSSITDPQEKSLAMESKLD